MQGDNMDRVIYLLLGEQKIPCQIAGIFGAWVITLRSSRKIFSSRIWTLTDAKILPLLAALMSVYRGCKSPPSLGYSNNSSMHSRKNTQFSPFLLLLLFLSSRVSRPLVTKHAHFTRCCNKALLLLVGRPRPKRIH